MAQKLLQHRTIKRLSGRRTAVTVCVAALAADFKAIVCVADKALSYGDFIQWDSDGSKIVKINPSGTLLLFSGQEMPISKVTGALNAKGKQLWWKDRNTIIQTCEDEFKLVLDRIIDSKFLAPRLLKREDYIKAVTGPGINEHMKDLAEQIAKFELDCDVLVCGFDMMETPFILSLESPGIVTDMTMTGFHGIGCGAEKAISRFLFAEHKRTHSIERTLFDAFDAKAFSEMSQGVGYEWDAVVILPNNGFHDVPEHIKKLIEKVWGKATRSPFDRFDPKEHYSLPRNWKAQLSDFFTSLSGKPKLLTAKWDEEAS
jgi:hypothetical protein